MGISSSERDERAADNAALSVLRLIQAFWATFWPCTLWTGMLRSGLVPTPGMEACGAQAVPLKWEYQIL